MPHNAEQVISDIEDVKDDLHDNVESTGRARMTQLKFDAETNVSKDADWRGNLLKSLYRRSRDRGSSLEFEVGTNPQIAPYAPFVEFGTGRRTLRITPRAGSREPRLPEEPPTGYPFSSPTIKTSQGFEEFAASIIEWVETKPIIPEEDITQEALGYKIAATIIEEGTYAHPFLQPAWFDNEQRIKRGFHFAVKNAFR